MSVIPKASGTIFGGEFLEYPPQKDYAKTEVGADPSWKGGHLPFIKSSKIATAELPLEPSFKRFLDLLWKPAELHRDLPQTNYLAQTRVAGAGARQALQPGRPPVPTFQNVSPTKPAAQAPHLDGLARDWKGMLDLKREIAFTFRGDSRSPQDMKTVYKGFQPNSARNDQMYLHNQVFEAFASYLQRGYQKQITLDQFKDALSKAMSDPQSTRLFVEYASWRMLIKSEEMHIGRMLANEVLKGYISTTKAVPVAKGFALTKVGATEGWVYCVLIEGGYEVPDQGKSHWTATFGEQEIAYPGAVAWDKIYGFRKVMKATRKFEGNIFLRSGFTASEKDAAEQVDKLLSGKVQKQNE